MNYSEFYKLERKQSWNPPTEQVTSGIDSFKLKWGIEPPKEKIQILYKSKKAPTEFLVCGLLYYFHESLLKKFEKAGITGWKTYPIELIRQDMEKEILDGYHVLTVFGRCGDRDTDRSVIVQKIYPYANENCLKGTYFINDEWDGNDFFMFKNEGFIFITKKVKDLLIKEQIKYAEYLPLTEMTFEDIKLKDKVFEDIENGTYNGDYLDYLDVARIYYGYGKAPIYLDAMKDVEFKKLWDICNTKENYQNNELIEKLLRRYPDSESTIQSLSVRKRSIGESGFIAKFFPKVEYILSPSRVAKRYSNFKNLK